MKRVCSLCLSVVLILSLCSPVHAIADTGVGPAQSLSSNDLVVFVPGIMGSELQYKAKKVWSPLTTDAQEILENIEKLFLDETGASNYTISVLNDDNFVCDAMDIYPYNKGDTPW